MRKVSTVLTITLIVILQCMSCTFGASCPGNGNCNGQGTCNNGVCSCFPGWAGDDCSYAVSNVTSGTPLTGQHVENRQWKFYTISLTQGSGMIITVNQTSSGDVDLYVLQGDFPSRTHYTYRDITTTNNFALGVDNAVAGSWYMGIYGFLATDYTFAVTVTSSNCPTQNNCNPPNGVCVSAGTCSCNSGWTGTDCSTAVKTVTFGQSYQDSVANKGWTLYTATITKNNNMRVSVNQLSGDVDLYIRYSSVPDLWHYDFRDTSLSVNFSIAINEPQLGTWYFGFYGYSQSSFSFIVSNSNQCPSNCSNHGSCRAAECQCQSGYNGVYCQNLVSAMTLGATYPGYVESNSWNYFFVQAQTQNNLQITLQETNNGDCDVYVKQGAQPTKFDYDYKNIGTSSTVQLTVPDPAGTWYIGVYGFSTCSYTVTVNIVNTCPGNPPCAGHGTCTSQGICNCDDGYAGSNCSLAVSPITSGATIYPVSVGLNGWNYYRLYVNASSFVAVGVKETSTVGYLWLYAGKGSMPDLHNYDFSDQDTNSKYHHINMQFDSPQTDEWLIGVYANPFALHGPISYSLSAWYSPF